MAKTTTATKKTVTKKTTAVKENAVKKVAAKKTAKVTKKAPATSPCDLTMIIAKVDAGWGNSVYIRGNGAGLNWEKGVLMQCVGDNEWLWEKKSVKSNFEFKFVLNDEVWAVGENVIGKAGEIHTYHPTF